LTPGPRTCSWPASASTSPATKLAAVAAGLEDSATDQSAPLTTRAALELQPLLALELAVGACAIAPWADKPWGVRHARTSSSHQQLALLRRAVLFEELGSRQTALALHFVLLHDEPPVQVCPSSQLGSSCHALHLARLSDRHDQFSPKLSSAQMLQVGDA